jgi:pyruvate/2-oxoglutarate dehydrogenase complex dihydrolipoamide acyltransferase (E2) component
VSEQKLRNLQVSIITPAYVKDEQGLQWLHETIASVMGQTRRDCFEMVVVNDGSPVDLGPLRETWKAATANQSLRWIEGSHQGVSAARNQAASEARAPLLLPLDADDKLARTAIETLLAEWPERDKAANILYTDVVMFGQDYSRVYLAEEYSFKTLLQATFMTVGCLHKKADWEAVGGWRLDMTQGLEDWEYWIALGERGVCGQRVAEPLYYYRRHPTGRLQWLKANQELWDRAYQAMRDLHLDSYNGRYPVGCCGGRSPRGATRPLHGGVPRAMPAPRALPGKDEMIQLLYVGSRRGDFRVVAQPTRTQYHIPGSGGMVEFDETGVQGVRPEDVAWFRAVNQGRDFRIIQPAAPAPPPPPPAAPRPAPKSAPQVEQSEAWVPEVMEPPEREIADWEPEDEPDPVSITDAAQALADEYGLDWSAIQGTGRDGTILVKDVRAALENLR